MSTSETVEFDIGPCPCGKGKIIKSVTTQDNPWSSADIHVALACANCGSQWRVEHGRMVKKSSETEYNVAQNIERSKHQALERLSNSLVNDYFEAFAAKTKKAEHAEMVRLGIANSNYRVFLKARADAGTPAGACHAQKNGTWLRTLAKEAGLLSEFDSALDEYKAAKSLTSEAYRNIVRWPIPKA